MGGSALRTRVWALGAVVAVAAVLGFPLWLFTTSVERLPIPHVDVGVLGNGFPYVIPVHLIDVPEPLGGLVDDAQRCIDARVPQLAHVNLQITLALDPLTNPLDLDPLDSRYKVQLVLSESEMPSYALSTGPDRLVKVFVTESIIANDSVADYIASVLVEHVFAEEIASLQSISGANGPSPALAINYNPTIVVSLNLLRARGAPLSWDLQSPALARFVAFVRLLESNGFARFHIETQEDWYEDRVHTASETFVNGTTFIDDTASFVDYSAWGLDQSVGLDPVLNLVVYVPEGETVQIANSTSNSFIVPQWGGVAIQNSGNLTTIPEQDMVRLMDIFASQLLQLLGGSLSNQSIYFRIDTLVRRQALLNTLHTISNGESLQKLTQQLQTIPIPQETVDEINLALSFMQNSLQNRSDSWWIEANRLASTALALSHKAFFQKDMLQQAYFPDEHKTAVYSPLLGPFATILFMGTMRLYKELRS